MSSDASDGSRATASNGASTEAASSSPTTLPGYLPWEQDLQMVSRFLDKKAEFEESYQQYITNNPELKAVLADFMQAVLIQKPDNVYVFAQEFFAPFAPNCVPTPSYPSYRVD